MSEDRLLGMPEVAALLDVPVGTLRTWRLKGYGPTSFRVGKHVRYRRSDVKVWINGQIDEALRCAGRPYW